MACCNIFAAYTNCIQQVMIRFYDEHVSLFEIFGDTYKYLSTFFPLYAFLDLNVFSNQSTLRTILDNKKNDEKFYFMTQHNLLQSFRSRTPLHPQCKLQ